METPLPPRKSKKGKLVGVLIIIVLVVGVAAYFYVRHVFTRLNQAEQVIADAQAYQITSDALQTEHARCQDFIVQRRGDFGDFEYCKAFINWVASNQLLP
ncbi:MAG: hypothetical protein WD200_02205 [Candidatus Andersenbacteria bacterium]